MNRIISGLAILLLTALPALGATGEGILVRYALLYGHPEETELPAQASGLASNSRLTELLLAWNPSADEAELRELLDLRGLYELARQAVDIPARGGKSRGVFFVEGKRFDVEIEVTPREEPETVEFALRLSLEGELISAPRVISLYGEHATVSTREEDGSMLFLVIEGRRLEESESAPPSRPEIERIDGIPLVDGERVTPPRLVERVAHRYTDEAKEARIQGVVILRLRIGEDGRVEDAEVRKGLPYGLEEAAVEAARQWRFEPPRVEGEVSEVLYDFVFRFEMEGERASEN